MKIQKSTDYSAFESPICQRLINQNRVVRIAESMRKNGFIISEHITVRKKGTHYQIMKGQHRFLAAQLAKVPVFYFIDEDMKDGDVIETEQFRSNWSISDFVTAQANRGNENYDVLLAFAEKYKIPMGTAACLLDGSMGERNARSGSFVPSREKEAHAVVELANALNFDGKRDSRFLYALSRVVGLPAFDQKRFLSGKVGLTLLAKQRTVDAYVQMIEDVYNFSRSTKVNLAWQVKEIQARSKMEALQTGRLNANKAKK